MAPLTLNPTSPSFNPAVTPAPLASVGSNPASYLREGASGPDVAQLQTMLKNAGFDPQSGTPPDGKLGPKTEAALKAFQTARGLTPDGVVGPDTKAALLKLPSRSAPAPAPSRSTPARAGDGFETSKAKPVTLNPPAAAAPGDVVAQARSELGKNAHDVKLGSDTIGQAMRDDVGDRVCCANFVGASLLAAGQIGSKDLSASVDGLTDKLRKTGNFTESHSLDNVQAGDVVAFDHAHVMICTGRDPKTNQPTFIGSNNENKDGTQKISEGPLTKWFSPNSPTLKAWESNVVVMHHNS